jgi:hypothetical protein
MKTIITETFRRVVATTTAQFKKALEDDVKRLLSLPNFKADFKDVKIEIKPSVKDDVLIIDCTGEGADSVSRKLKDLATKHKATVKIKNEKPMSGIKEGEQSLPKVGDTIKHKLTGAEFVLDKVTPTEISGKLTKLGTLKGGKIGNRNTTSPKLIGTNYEILPKLDEGKAMPSIIGSVLNKLQDDLGPEVANPLWRDKAAEITDIINSVRNMTGTSTGQKVQTAADRIKKLQTMNENKKPKLDLRKMILEAMEVVKAEAKAEKEEAPEEETGTEESPEAEGKPKAKKLEKDEIGKFYIVTRPAKADDNIVHETNVLDLITKIKSGELDASRILGAFKKRGGANALAKVQLKTISAELDELKQHMEEYRNSKKTLEASKAKAKSTILKYKPASDNNDGEANV